MMNPQNTVNPRTKMHFYTMAVEISYKRDDTAKQRRMNVMLQLEEKNIPFVALDNARMAAMQRLTDEMQVPAEDMVDYVILNVSYLGHMSERQFQAKLNPERSKVPTTH